MQDLVKLDEKEKEILFELDLNSRISLTELSKKTHLSPQTTKYRMNQLEKKRIIRGYVTLFDVSKFGYQYYRLYIRYEQVGKEEEQRIIDYLLNHKRIVWFVSTGDKWDLEICFVAKNFIDYNNILREMYKKFPDELHNNITTVSIANYHQPRSYLVNKEFGIKASYGGMPEELTIDSLDKKIMKFMNQNARMSNAEIGKKVGVSHKTVNSRIKKMEQRGIIRGYRLWMDFFKFGSVYNKALFKLRKFTRKEENRCLKFCKEHPNVIYLITCVFPWDVELEVESQNKKDFLDVVKDFRMLMGNNVLDYESLTISAEHKLNYCPFSEEF